jgi:asparagine synthase (glutamine-hydrolysing)
MTIALPPQPGFVAVSRTAGSGPSVSLSSVAAALQLVDESHRSVRTLDVMSWGFGRGTDALTVVLGRGGWRTDHLLDSADVRGLLERDGRAHLVDVLPPFAAAGLMGDAVRVAVDALGFRHVYGVQGPGWAAVSTSSRALGLLAGSRIDLDAVAVQSMLGWQLRQRTLYEDVDKLPPASISVLAHGRISTSIAQSVVHEPSSDVDEAVRRASSALRDFMAAYLDARPEAALQLTGGQDSRLLLSAIPLARRRGMTAVTVGVPADDDVRIARNLTDENGMVHVVADRVGLDQLAPAEVFALTLRASQRVDFMADPLGFLSVASAEAQLDQGSRLVGLGGEVARGFYYFPWRGAQRVTRRSVERLASWRMFANEAADPVALRPEFHRHAREFALSEVFDLLAESSDDLRTATDDFYLSQRMQRWAGVTDTAVCYERELVNPMLDRRFLDIVRGLSPSHKRNSRFLAQLQVELDPALASIPLEGRPAPVVYARGGVDTGAHVVVTSARKFARKVDQRLRGARRPPTGAGLLADKLAEHWQGQPDSLRPLFELDVFDEPWLEGVLQGTVRPDASTAAFMVNLLGACEPT